MLQFPGLNTHSLIGLHICYDNDSQNMVPRASTSASASLKNFIEIVFRSHPRLAFDMIIGFHLNRCSRKFEEGVKKGEI